MKIVLDEKVCLKKKLTLQEALIATAMSMSDFKTTFKNMMNRGIIDPTGSRITKVWKETIDSLQNSEDERLNNLAIQMRECYPKGKLPGTAFYYRCNVKEIVFKLKKFFEVNGNYTDEEIINATKKFVASYRGDYSRLPLLKYFISKNKKVMDEEGENHIFEVSELASTLENMDEDDNIPEIENSDDWLMNSRN